MIRIIYIKTNGQFNQNNRFTHHFSANSKETISLRSLSWACYSKTTNRNHSVPLLQVCLFSNIKYTEKPPWTYTISSFTADVGKNFRISIWREIHFIVLMHTHNALYDSIPNVDMCHKIARCTIYLDIKISRDAVCNSDGNYFNGM